MIRPKRGKIDFVAGEICLTVKTFQTGARWHKCHKLVAINKCQASKSCSCNIASHRWTVVSTASFLRTVRVSK